MPACSSATPRRSKPWSRSTRSSSTRPARSRKASPKLTVGCSRCARREEELRFACGSGGARQRTSAGCGDCACARSADHLADPSRHRVRVAARAGSAWRWLTARTSPSETQRSCSNLGSDPKQLEAQADALREQGQTVMLSPIDQPRRRTAGRGRSDQSRARRRRSRTFATRS